ncbi:hypothetical protein FSP39_021274 [Pinctada imbricata]|uniref:C2H2-type domain-containing protein n=1 Tax=Pinctada imbricata TaxID=66713 RepID=A0AA88XNB1_PINIB|nr:hypothetical protein FSP39_021274 [Pinctada imbricata]
MGLSGGNRRDAWDSKAGVGGIHGVKGREGENGAGMRGKGERGERKGRGILPVLPLKSRKREEIYTHPWTCWITNYSIQSISMEIDIGSARNDDQSKDVVVEYNIDTEGNHHGNSLHDNNKLINNEKIHIDRRKMRFKLFPEKGNWQKEISDNDHDDEEAETENKAFKSCITETKENLMKFAEILYKCTLCTSMPSILTSESSFVSHVIEEHLKKHVSSISCPQCELVFGTEEDLKFHVSFSHADSSLSSIENFISVKSEEKCSELLFSQLWSVNKEGCVPKSLDLSKCIKKRKSRQALGSHSFPESNSINNMNDTECSPKITISHEPENPHRHLPMENRVKLQELTNEIFTKQKDVGGLHMGVDVSQIGAIKNVSSTPEFGKYTKLVREGGSIVYFCQVCNWKSQIKVHFDGHCKNKVHQTKVKVAEEQRTADQNDIEKRKQELPLSLVNKSEVPNVRKLDVPNLTENQNSEDEEKKCQSVQRTKRVSPARPNKRKRSSVNVVRYYDHNNDWNSSDSNSSNSSYFIPMRESSLEQVTKTKKSKLCNAQSPQSLVKQEINVISPQAKEMSPLQTLLHSDHNKFQPNQFVSSKAVFPEFQATSTSYESRKTSSPVTSTGSALLNQLLSLTPKFSSSPFSPPTMPSRNDTKENDKHYDDSCKVQTEIPEIPSSDLKSERESPKMHCTEVPIMQHSESATKPSQEDSSHHFTSLQSGPNKCGFCPKTFESDTLLRLHLERCHLKRFDEVFQVHKSSDDPQKEGFGEVSKIIKLKLVIPNLLFSTPHGNVSREQLLQKFSELTDINEAVQWGPACNKAIRELFPDSTAQRKGKYKKYPFR